MKNMVDTGVLDVIVYGLAFAHSITLVKARYPGSECKKEASSRQLRNVSLYRSTLATGSYPTY